MCDLTKPVTTGLTSVGTPPTFPTGDSPETTGDLPLSPRMTIPRTEMQPTKLAKLLKFAMPMAQGALIGGFGGNWRVPGSGFSAYENFLQTKNNMAMQKLAMQQSMQNNAALRKYRDAEAQRMLEYNAQQTRDVEQPDGSIVTMQFNPKTSRYDIPVGKSGRMAERARPQVVDSSQGLIEQEPGSNDWRRVHIKDDEQVRPSTDETEGEPGWSVTGGRPPQQQSSIEPIPGEPLHKFTRPAAAPRPIKETSRDARGVETDQYVDPATMKPVGGPVTRQPKPRAGSTRQPPKPDTGVVETYTQRILGNVGGDTKKALDAVAGMNIPADVKGRIQKRLEDIDRQNNRGKKDFRRFLSPEQQKQLETGGGAPGQMPAQMGP